MTTPADPVPETPKFGFLARYDGLLVHVAALAERYFPDDPVTALVKLRQFGELLAQQVAARRGVDTLAGLDEQAGALRYIDTGLASGGSVHHEATRALALLERLEQSILAKAFRGELVPQDPSEEPATALLARLQPSATAPRRGRPRRSA